jgi:hypothetical protein
MNYLESSFVSSKLLMYLFLGASCLLLCLHVDNMVMVDTVSVKII